MSIGARGRTPGHIAHSHGRRLLAPPEVGWIFDEDWNGLSGGPLSNGWVHAVGTDPTVLTFADLDLSVDWGPLGWGQVVQATNSGTDINRFDYALGVDVRPSFISIEFSPTAVGQTAFTDDAATIAIRDNANTRNLTAIVMARKENTDPGNDVWVEATGTGLDWWHGIGDPRAFRLECSNFDFGAGTFDLRIFEIFVNGDPDQLVYSSLGHSFQTAGLTKIDSIRMVSQANDSIGKGVINRVYIEGVLV